MAATIVTYRPAPTWPAPSQHRPHESAEVASRLAVECAESSECVLVLTGVPDQWTNTTRISRKPKAIRIERRPPGFDGIIKPVDQFAVKLNDRPSKEWAAGARRRPVVIVNDADYFFTDGCCGDFTRYCDDETIKKARLLEETVAVHGGQLVVFAAFNDETDRWTQTVNRLGWDSHGTADVFSPDRYVSKSAKACRSVENWIHPASAEPPVEYAYGPLEGSQKQLAITLFADEKGDYRRVRMKAKHGNIWVRRVHGRLIQIWFRTESDFALAESRLAMRR